MSKTSQKSLAVLLGPGLPVAVQMRWAARLAAARNLNLLVLHGMEGRDERVSEVSLEEPPKGEATGVVHELRGFIDESPGLSAYRREILAASDDAVKTAPAPALQVRLMLVYSENLASFRRMVLELLRDDDVVLATRASEKTSDISDIDLVRERRFFFRYAPCELVLCHGLKANTAFRRVLVATDSGNSGRAALRLGADLASANDGAMTALHVNPNIGVDAEHVGERRLQRNLDRNLGSDQPEIARRIVISDQLTDAIRGVWDEGQHDIVLVGSTAARLESGVSAQLGKGATIVTVCPASPLTNRFRAFVEESVLHYVPQIAREERVELVDRVQSSAAWNFDFLALMVLSTIMASIGLIQNSAAVVIGAMLVAPLMTPLLGLGLALVQGNPVLARMSLRSVVLGVCVSLLGGLLVGLFTPALEEPTREMLARGGPGLLDLSVAFAAGLAAAYASSRSSLIAALPGVAIAAALVPPIATSGLALSLGDIPLAIGALLLFIINMVTIVLAAMTSLWLVGIRNIREASGWTMLSGGAVIAAVLALGVFLSLQPQEDELTGRLPEGLVEAVQESIGEGYQFDSLAVAYDELGVQLNVQVIGSRPAPDEMATTVRTLISDQYRRPVRVRLLTKINADATSQVKPRD